MTIDIARVPPASIHVLACAYWPENGWLYSAQGRASCFKSRRLDPNPMKLLLDVGLLDFKAQEGPTGLSGSRLRFQDVGRIHGLGS